MISTWSTLKELVSHILQIWAIREKMKWSGKKIEKIRWNFLSLTREDVKAGLLVLRRVSVGGVADDHTRLADGSVADQHAADHVGVQLVLPGQPASGRNSGLVVKVIHLRWHVEPNWRELEGFRLSWLRCDLSNIKECDGEEPGSEFDWRAACVGTDVFFHGQGGAPTGANLHRHAHSGQETGETDPRAQKLGPQQIGLVYYS